MSRQESRAPREEPEVQAVPGPLGWLEVTMHLMRDRSASSWMFLQDEELLTVLRERGVVAAHLPGEVLSIPDVVLVRVAVSPEGRVAVLGEDGEPTEGPPVEDFVPSLLDALKTVALVEPDQPVGPPWLPVDEILADGHQPAEDSRVVYCYKGTEVVVAASFARTLEVPVTVYRADGWTVAAMPHRPEKVLGGPPPKFSGAYPFVVLDRRGQQRTFGYAESAKETSLRVSAEWRPPMRPAVPAEGTGPAAELARWLADPRGWGQSGDAPAAEGDAPQRPEGMTAEQEAVLQRWMAEAGDASGFLRETCAAFGVPEIAAELVETPAGRPDPVGGQVVEPMGAGALMRTALAEQDTEPEGKLPWQVLDRALWHRPALGIALGAGELVLGLLLIVLLVAGVLGGIWLWVIGVVIALAGIAHLVPGVVRLRGRQREAAAQSGGQGDASTDGDG